MSYFVNKENDLPAQEVWPGIVGHLIHTERSTIADFRIAAGTVLPEHAHPHEQTSTVLEGRFRFVVGGEERICVAGEVAVIPGNVPHSGEALTDCRIVDVFAPVREDYRS
ncbi:MAG: cupin domain-containing protein [Bacteroidota bacterium]